MVSFLNHIVSILYERGLQAKLSLPCVNMLQNSYFSVLVSTGRAINILFKREGSPKRAGIVWESLAADKLSRQWLWLWLIENWNLNAAPRSVSIDNAGDRRIDHGLNTVRKTKSINFWYQQWPTFVEDITKLTTKHIAISFHCLSD